MTTESVLITATCAGLGFFAVDIPDAGLVDNIGGMALAGILVMYLIRTNTKQLEKIIEGQTKQDKVLDRLTSVIEKLSE